MSKQTLSLYTRLALPASVKSSRLLSYFTLVLKRAIAHKRLDSASKYGHGQHASIFRTATS